MRILFLHGLDSLPGGTKPTFLRSHGHEVLNPLLARDDFPGSVAVAQREIDDHRPEVIVGSSRGGAVGLAVDPGDARLVLIAPAWKFFDVAPRARAPIIVLHSRHDDVVPFEHSVELIERAGLDPDALWPVGADHGMSDPEALAALLRATESPRLRDSESSADL